MFQLYLTLMQQRLTKAHSYNMTKIVLSPTMSIVITGRPIWVRKHWLGSVTGVACYGWSRVWGAGGPGFKSWGESPFLKVSVSNEISYNEVGLGLIMYAVIFMFHLIVNGLEHVVTSTTTTLYSSLWQTIFQTHSKLAHTLKWVRH